MKAFEDWYFRYRTEILWMLIGLLTYAGLDSLSKGRYFLALFDCLLIWLNYKNYKTEIK